MSTDQDPSSLQQILDLLAHADYQDGRVSWREIMDVVGSRSFGPMLLIAGLIVLAPVIGDIPGVPTMIAMFLVLVMGQLLLGREHVWLPNFLLNRSVAEHKLHKAIGWMKKPAGFIDRLMKPRLVFLVEGTMSRIIALLCLGIALIMPSMELVPFSANLAGAALTAFGLALLARDGLLALIALGLLAPIIGVALSVLF